MNPQEPAQKTDAAPSSLHAYQLPKHIGRYYNIMITCCAPLPNRKPPNASEPHMSDTSGAVSEPHASTICDF